METTAQDKNKNAEEQQLRQVRKQRVTKKSIENAVKNKEHIRTAKKIREQSITDKKRQYISRKIKGMLRNTQIFTNIVYFTQFRLLVVGYESIVPFMFT